MPRVWLNVERIRDRSDPEEQKRSYEGCGDTETIHMLRIARELPCLQRRSIPLRQLPSVGLRKLARGYPPVL
jgi:hypothetical protein